MTMNATRPIPGRSFLAPLVRAILLALGLLALGYLAVVADTNTQMPQSGFSGHAAASQISAPATWDGDPQVNPAAKVAEPIATF